MPISNAEGYSVLLIMLVFKQYQVFSFVFNVQKQRQTTHSFLRNLKNGQ